MKLLDTRPVALATLVLAALLGGSSLLLFAVFLWRGSLGFVNLGLEAPWLYVWDTLLCWAFFLQHSLMIRRSFRARWLAAVPTHSHGAWYTIASGLTLLGVVVLWQESPLYHDQHTGLVVQLMVLGWALAALILVWALVVLRVDVLGLDTLVDRLRDRARPPREDFVVRGPYRLVRHPLYLACLLVIWAGPQLTADRLLFDILWTVWIFVGAKLEERDLENDFGEAYAKYRREVPMIIPWRASPSAFVRRPPRDEQESRP